MFTLHLSFRAFKPSPQSFWEDFSVDTSSAHFVLKLPRLYLTKCSYPVSLTVLVEILCLLMILQPFLFPMCTILFHFLTVILIEEKDINKSEILKRTCQFAFSTIHCKHFPIIQWLHYLSTRILVLKLQLLFTQLSIQTVLMKFKDHNIFPILKSAVNNFFYIYFISYGFRNL